MSDKKKTYNILIVDEYTDSSGKDRKHYWTVGKAWPIESGGMSCQLPDGVSVSGRFVILPRTEKDDTDQ